MLAATRLAGQRSNRLQVAVACYDNAFAESVFASLKSELLPESQPFLSKYTASLALFGYLETFYNRTRRHSHLGGVSPEQFKLAQKPR